MKRNIKQKGKQLPTDSAAALPASAASGGMLGQFSQYRSSAPRAEGGERQEETNRHDAFNNPNQFRF